MSNVTPRSTDKKARLILPARFASSAVLVEDVSETELRIRKAVTLPEDEVPFTEEQRSPLSDEDRDIVLSLLAAPPKANAALKKAYVDEAEVICAKANADQKALTTPTGVAAFAPYVTKVVAIAEQATTGVAALTPPPADKAELQAKFLGPLQEQLRDAQTFAADIEAATKGNDQAALLRLAGNPPTKTRADLTFMEGYGFDACVQAADTSS